LVSYGSASYVRISSISDKELVGSIAPLSQRVPTTSRRFVGIYYGRTSFDICILYMYLADEFDNHSLYPRHMVQDLHRCSDLDRLCGFYPLGGGDEGNEIHARNNQSPGV
jgi:hypothetical protein